MDEKRFLFGILTLALMWVVLICAAALMFYWIVLAVDAHLGIDESGEEDILLSQSNSLFRSEVMARERCGNCAFVFRNGFLFGKLSCNSRRFIMEFVDEIDGEFLGTVTKLYPTCEQVRNRYLSDPSFCGEWEGAVT